MPKFYNFRISVSVASFKATDELLNEYQIPKGLSELERMESLLREVLWNDFLLDRICHIEPDTAIEFVNVEEEPDKETIQ